MLSKERLERETQSAPPSDGVDDRFCGISLRPGTLTDEKAGGVTAGRIGAGGKTSRATTAQAIVAALETEGARGWFDVIDGEENVKDAFVRLSQEGTDTADEEDFEAMKKNVAQW